MLCFKKFCVRRNIFFAKNLDEGKKDFEEREKKKSSFRCSISLQNIFGDLSAFPDVVNISNGDFSPQKFLLKNLS